MSNGALFNTNTQILPYSLIGAEVNIEDSQLPGKHCLTWMIKPMVVWGVLDGRGMSSKIMTYPVLYLPHFLLVPCHLLLAVSWTSYQGLGHLCASSFVKKFRWCSMKLNFLLFYCGLMTWLLTGLQCSCNSSPLWPPVTKASFLWPHDTEKKTCALDQDTPGQSDGCITCNQCAPVAAMLSQIDLMLLWVSVWSSE